MGIENAFELGVGISPGDQAGYSIDRTCKIDVQSTLVYSNLAEVSDFHMVDIGRHFGT